MKFKIYLSFLEQEVMKRRNFYLNYIHRNVNNLIYFQISVDSKIFHS